MFYFECTSCNHNSTIHPLAANHNGRCPHCNVVLTTRVEMEEPSLITGTSPAEVQATVTTEGTIRIITDTPASVISQRISYLLESRQIMPKEVQIITRNDDTAYRLNKILSSISICSMHKFCCDAVKGVAAAAGFPLHHIMSSGLSKMLFNSALRELQLDYPPEEQQLHIDQLLALKEEQDYSSQILSGQFHNLANDGQEIGLLKKFLELQHRYGILDYDDVLMILLEAYSPVPVKYLLVEDAACYSYWELLLLQQFGQNITFLQYPFQEITGHDPEQFAEIFSNCTEITLSATAQFQRL